MPQIILHDDFEYAQTFVFRGFRDFDLKYQVHQSHNTLIRTMADEPTLRGAQEAMYVLASMPSLGNSL